MKYAAYEGNVATSVQWLNELPKHWGVERLKAAATYCVSNVDKVSADNELPVRLCNYTDVYYNDLITPDMGLMETTATVEEIRKFGLRVNDVVITKDSEDWRDIAVPAMVAKTAPDLVCGYHLAIVRPRADKIYGPFLLRLFQSSAVNQQFQIAASGVTRHGLPKSAIGEAWLPLPPLDEQQTIARFLDAKTAQIDELIAKKRQLIDKLKEKRQALIARTVTRGLPPEAAKAAGLEPAPAMKDSGVDWLGEIPAHWEATQLKRTWATCEYGISESLSGEGDIRVLTMGNIQDGRATLPSAGCLENVVENMLLNDGDLLFNRTNSLAHVGKVGIYRPDGKGLVSFASYLVRIRPNSRTTPEFMTYLLNIPQLLSFARGLALPSINQANLNPTRYGQIHVALPPIQEQNMIVEYVDREASKVDRLTSEVEIAITRLTEYRQALITSAVTGKIDVRGLA
jgi:type I restriction enzyme S subunit